jgi:hypothetical protein
MKEMFKKLFTTMFVVWALVGNLYAQGYGDGNINNTGKDLK